MTHLTDDDADRYYAGELDSDGEARLEEHAMGCGACSQRLLATGRLVHALRDSVRSGDALEVIDRSVLDRMRAEGVRVQEVELGGARTVFRRDADVLVGRVAVDLRGVRRITLEYRSSDGTFRQPGIPVDGGTELFVTCSRHGLRGRTERESELRVLDAEGPRELGRWRLSLAVEP